MRARYGCGVAARAGWCDEELLEDFPGIGIFQRGVAVDDGAERRTRRRFDLLGPRIDGPRAASMALDTVPAAYSALARQLGLDPDSDAAPLMSVLRERIRRGQLVSHGAVRDACTCAMLETGVPVFALPLSQVGGDLGLMIARDGERLPGADVPLPAGAIVVSDLSRPLALALQVPALTPQPREGAVLYAIRAPKLSDIELEEALWIAASLLDRKVAESSMS